MQPPAISARLGYRVIEENNGVYDAKGCKPINAATLVFLCSNAHLYLTSAHDFSCSHRQFPLSSVRVKESHEGQEIMW